MPVSTARHETGIVVALPAEARSLGVGQWRAGRCVASPWGHVAMAGIGRERAAAAAVQLLDLGVQALLSWGVAGALVPSLQPGDLLLPERVLSPDGEWQLDACLRARMAETLSIRDADAPARLWCSGSPVTRVEDKRDLAQQGLHAVDMESAAVASVAARAGVPFAAVKAICDSAACALPAAALKLLRGDGRPRVRGWFEAVAGGPGLWRELDQLRHDFDAARRALRQAAQHMPTGERA